MDTDKVFFKNLICRFAERCGAQIVSVIVSIVLGPLLDPCDYGTVILITVFTKTLIKGYMHKA